MRTSRKRDGRLHLSLTEYKIDQDENLLLVFAYHCAIPIDCSHNLPERMFNISLLQAPKQEALQ